MRKYGLGYLQLNPDDLMAYTIIEQALLNMQTVFDVSKIKRHVDLLLILNTVLGDSPDILYFDKNHLQIATTLSKRQITLQGIYNKSLLMKINTELKNHVEAAIWEIDGKFTTDQDIIRGISEYLQQHVKYDNEELLLCSKGQKGNPISHNAYGALVKGLAVCDGIAGAFVLLAQQLGFKCTVVTGKSMNQNHSLVEHAWNIIEVWGKYYHVDATWDVNSYELMGVYSYIYLGLDDDEIANDHQWNIQHTPTCSGSKLSYYRKHNLFANNEAQLEDIILRELKNQKKIVRVQLSHNVPLPSDTERYLGQKVLTAAEKLGQGIEITYTYNDRLRCFTVVVK